MTISRVKDVVLFRMNAVEMRQVMERHGMIQTIWSHILADMNEADQTGRWIPSRLPLKIFHEERARGHILQCRVHLWRYFREVDAANPLEREIRAEMMLLGISGDADRRSARFSARGAASIA